MDTTCRIEKIRKYMLEEKLDYCVVNSPENMQYLSSFQAITYSRPIVFVIDHETTHLIIPAIEEKHAHLESTGVKHLHVYYEHPEMAQNAASVIDCLKKILKPNTRVGAEFRSASLSFVKAIESMNIKIYNISELLVEMRYIKEEIEKNYIREAGRLCQYAFKKSLEYAHMGVSEMEFEQHGTAALYELLGEEYPYAFSSPGCITPSGAARTVLPHVYSSTRRFENGDMVIHVRKPAINGYYAELERTFFIGNPQEKAKHAFSAMLEAQMAVMEQVKPGKTAAELDKIGRDVLRKYGYEDYAIHRIGHGQGLGRHEEPYLIFNSNLVLQKDMVFTIEPGIYIEGIGGFRHSDTLIITENGYENVTEFPRSLEEMTFV